MRWRGVLGRVVMGLLGVACVELPACTATNPPAEAKQGGTAGDVAEEDAAPTKLKRAPIIDEPEMSYEPTYGEPVEFTATYAVDPVRGGKNLQAGYLLLDDKDETWIVSYRPDPALFEFIDKHVVVKGRPYTNSPYVQSVGGTHFELETIELAPGETPYAEAPTRLPSPPHVQSLEALEVRDGRWAHITGVLALPPTSPEESWPSGTLTLGPPKSGLTVRLRGNEAQLRPHESKRVTVLARVTNDDEGRFLSMGKICPGRVLECGVDRPTEP